MDCFIRFFRTHSTDDQKSAADEIEDGHEASFLEQRTSDESYMESSHSDSSDDERVPRAPRYFYF